MSHEIERDWITAAGLRAVCILIHGSHRCGYVELPTDHPLHGVGYSETHPSLTSPSPDTPVGKRGLIPLLLVSMISEGEIPATPEIIFDVHGGITFAGGDGKYPADGDGWWFGFDCAHAGDGSLNPKVNWDDSPVRSTEYVASECESLAAQLKEITT
jgi:hypothetical protein